MNSYTEVPTQYVPQEQYDTVTPDPTYGCRTSETLSDKLLKQMVEDAVRKESEMVLHKLLERKMMEEDASLRESKNKPEAHTAIYVENQRLKEEFLLLQEDNRKLKESIISVREDSIKPKENTRTHYEEPEYIRLELEEALKRMEMATQTNELERKIKALENEMKIEGKTVCTAEYPTWSDKSVNYGGIAAVAAAGAVIGAAAFSWLTDSDDEYYYY